MNKLIVISFDKSRSDQIHFVFVSQLYFSIKDNHRRHHREIRNQSIQSKASIHRAIVCVGTFSIKQILSINCYRGRRQPNVFPPFESCVKAMEHESQTQPDHSHSRDHDDRLHDDGRRSPSHSLPRSSAG